MAIPKAAVDFLVEREGVANARKAKGSLKNKLKRFFGV